MAGVNVDMESVVQRLASQVGQLSAQLAMTEAALEAAHKQLANVEQPDAAKP